VALIAFLAAVAVPTAVGSRTSRPFEPHASDRHHAVEVAATVRGPASTTMPLDPGARSDGVLDHGSTMYEPAPRTEPPQARPRAALAQPEPAPGIVSKDPWQLDRNVSWYGPGLIGNGTACGQTLTRTLVGVAHRSLPCGTKISFRSPASGEVVVAPVVDRGPFVDGRTWDLTYGLCKALEHCYTGPLEWRPAR
jgi:rare lipoprotein A (peptidoglycan hydrolase)